MAVIVTQGPEKVHLSKNKIIYELDTENYISVVPQKAESRFQLLDGPSIGDTIEIAAPGLPGGSVTYTYVAVPNTSGTQLPAYTSGTLYSYLAELIRYFLQNPFIAANYKVYIGSVNSLTFKAFDYGPDWTMTITHTGYTPSFVVNAPGVAAEFEPDFRVMARVIIESGYGELIHGDYEFKIPNDDGTLSWNFSDTIDELYPSTSLPLPSLTSGMNWIMPPDSGPVQVRIQLSEYYGETPGETPIWSTDPIYVAKGGFRSYDKNQSLITQFSLGKQFLTWQPKGRGIFQNTIAWLWFLNNDEAEAITQFRIWYSISFTDGTGVSAQHPISLNPNYGGTLYRKRNFIGIGCGYDQMLLNVLHPGKTPYKYSLDIRDQSNGFLVFAHTFSILDPSRMGTTFHYINSIGVLDVICFEGERGMMSSVSTETLRLPGKPRQEEFELTDLDYNQLLKSGIEVSTGALTKDSAQALQDFILSPRIWMVVPQSSGLARIAVRLEKANIQSGIKDYAATNVIPSKLKFVLNDERGYSNINKVWQ